MGFDESTIIHNNNKSYTPKDLQARGAVHYQNQNPLDNQKKRKEKVQVL